jgi:hypothetical protein
MRERNRLDEIADDELKHMDETSRWSQGWLGYRIAERAFREGAERGVERVVGDAVKYFDLSGVQPAPAKEKCLGGPVPHAPHEPPYHIRPDARKNERRMGNEALNFVHGPTRPETRQIYQVNDHGSWQYERRSGDDRRGAKF